MTFQLHSSTQYLVSLEAGIINVHGISPIIFFRTKFTLLFLARNYQREIDGEVQCDTLRPSEMTDSVSTIYDNASLWLF